MLPYTGIDKTYLYPIEQAFGSAIMVLHQATIQRGHHHDATVSPTSHARGDGIKPLSIITDHTSVTRNNKAVEMAKQRFAAKSPTSRRQHRTSSSPHEDGYTSILAESKSESMASVGPSNKTVVEASTKATTRNKLDLCPVCSLPVEYTDLSAKTIISRRNQLSIIRYQPSSESGRTMGTLSCINTNNEECMKRVKLGNSNDSSVAARCDFMRPLQHAVEEFVSGYCDTQSSMDAQEERQDSNTILDYESIASKAIPPYCANCRAYIINEAPEDTQEDSLQNLASWLMANGSGDEAPPGHGRISVVLDNDVKIHKNQERAESRLRSSTFREPVQPTQLIKEKTASTSPRWYSNNEAAIAAIESISRKASSPTSRGGTMSPRSRRYRRLLEEYETKKMYQGQDAVAMSTQEKLQSDPSRESELLQNSLALDSVDSAKENIGKEEASSPWEVVSDTCTEVVTICGIGTAETRVSTATLQTVRDLMLEAINVHEPRAEERSVEASILLQSISSGPLSMPSNGKQQNDQEFNDCAVVIDAELQNEPTFGDSGFPSRNTFDMNSLSIPKSDFAAKVEMDSNVLTLEQCSTFDEEMMIISRYEEKRQIATKAIGRKLMEDYVLTQDQCKQCHMPLMEREGVCECVVCPLVSKKAKKRAGRKRHAILNSPLSDGFESGYESSSPLKERMILSTSSGKGNQPALAVNRMVDITLGQKTERSAYQPIVDSNSALGKNGAHYPTEKQISIEISNDSKYIDHHRLLYPPVGQQALEVKRDDETIGYKSLAESGLSGKRDDPEMRPLATEGAVAAENAVNILGMELTRGTLGLDPLEESSRNSAHAMLTSSCENAFGDFHHDTIASTDSSEYAPTDILSMEGVVPGHVSESVEENNVPWEMQFCERDSPLQNFDIPSYDMGMASQRVYGRLLQGWLLSNSNCEVCFAPMMQSAETTDVECVFCAGVNRVAMEHSNEAQNDDVGNLVQERQNQHDLRASSQQCTFDQSAKCITKGCVGIENGKTTNNHTIPKGHASHAKAVTFSDPEVAPGKQHAQYIVIPDDFDFEDHHAVMNLFEEAKKNHRSSLNNMKVEKTTVQQIVHKGSLHDFNGQREIHQHSTHSSSMALHDKSQSSHQLGEDFEPENAVSYCNRPDEIDHVQKMQDISQIPQCVDSFLHKNHRSIAMHEPVACENNIFRNLSSSGMTTLSSKSVPHSNKDIAPNPYSDTWLQDCPLQTAMPTVAVNTVFRERPNHLDAVTAMTSLSSKSETYSKGKASNLYSDSWLHDKYEFEEKEEVPPDNCNLSREAPRSFDNLAAIKNRSSMPSHRKHGTMHFTPRDSFSDLTHERIPHWKDYVDDREIVTYKPEGLILHYRHNNNVCVSKRDTFHDDSEQYGVRTMYDKTLSATQVFAARGDVSRSIAAANQDRTANEIVLEMNHDTEELVLNFDSVLTTSKVQSSSLQSSPTKALAPKLLWSQVRPTKQSKSNNVLLSPEQQADKILKRFKLELVAVPSDPKYSFNEATRNMAVSPTSCQACGKGRQSFATSVDEVCGNHNCHLFMIPDDAVVAFSSATGHDFVEEEYDLSDQASDFSRMNSEFVNETLSSSSQLKALFAFRGEHDESSSIANDIDICGIKNFSSQTLTAVMTRMSAGKQQLDSPTKHSDIGQSAKEEVDLDILMKRLTLAAKAILELEQTIVESPRNKYQYLHGRP